MARLFSKIRYQNISKSKTERYLRYAIGEIILVVIGILIALQINNWNENRKATAEETVILKSLYDNISLAKHQSIQLINDEIGLKESLIQILNLGNVKNDFETVRISDSLFKSAVWDLQSDLPILNAYLNLKNTNQLRLIKNKRINEKFSELDFKYNKLIDLLKDRLSVHQIRIDDILENDVNFIPIAKSNVPEINIDDELSANYNEVLKNRRVRNLLGMKLSFTQDIIDRRLEFDQEIDDLLQLIKSELIER